MRTVSKTLLKPELKVIYLSNKMSEKVEYLEIAGDITKRSLEEDVKNGAVQFRETLDFVNKKKKSQLVVITADCKERGLMAITYISACCDRQNESSLGDFEEYQSRPTDPFAEPDFCDFDEDSASVWLESANKIPVLDVGEIKYFLRQNDEPFDMGGFRVMQSSVYNAERPYWTGCKKEAVCIICDKYQADSLSTATFELFRTNRRVFLLFIEENRDGFGMVNCPFGLDVSVFENIKNMVVLSHAADEVFVSMEHVDAKKYYTNIIKQSLKARNVKVARNFSYVRVINTAISVRKDAVCAMLELILNYALKDVESVAGLLLRNEDFDFVDRFLRTENRQAKEKAISRIREELVGMDEIKEQVLDTVNVMKYNKLRTNLNITGSKYHNVHVMLGAPGTAKTTVAKLMGQIMLEEKLLPDNRFICVNGAELKGQYVGQSAPKTKALFDNYDVIIIDEAYSLTEGGGTTDSFSNESIAQLIVELEKHSTDKLIIFAGYGGRNVAKKDNKMQSFLDANPGIKSRITSTFYFKSYTAPEMVEIFKRIAKLANYKVAVEAEELIEQFFKTRVKDSDFGNGREARNLLETSIVFAAKRVMALKEANYTAEELQYISLEDIRHAITKMEDSFGIRKASEEHSIGFQVS